MVGVFRAGEGHAIGIEGEGTVPKMGQKMEKIFRTIYEPIILTTFKFNIWTTVKSNFLYDSKIL